MIKKTALTLLAVTLMAKASSLAVEIPNGLSWLPSDPLDITLDGNQNYDLWLNLSSGANNSRTYINPLFPTIPFAYNIPGNSGYPGFASMNNPWPAPIKSQLWSGEAQGELIKISNGTGGGPFPSGSTIYYGGASPVPNTNGGTLGAKGYAIEGVQTVTFQLSLGEAYGYTLWDADGDGFGIEDMPALTIYDTSGGVLAVLQADYADIIKKAYNGSLDMPPGSGVDEDIYINTFGLQWDLSALSGEIGSFQVNWTGVQHAQLWSFRLDQTDVTYSDFVFDITSYWTGEDDGVWSSAGNWQDAAVASTVGKAVFAVGDGVELTADTTVGQITISSDEDFTIGTQNDSNLTVGLNIITEANGGTRNHTVSADVVLASTVTLDVGEDTTLTMAGNLSGVGIYKRGSGELALSGDNDFTGSLVFAGGTTIVNGTNTTSGASILDIKNARVILQGDDRFSSAFGAKLAGTSTPGQTAYLQLGDESTGAITQTFAQLNAVKPQYVKDLNPNPQTDPPVYVVGGSSEISTLTVKGGIYSGYLGGEGLYENNFSLVVDGNLTLQGISTYVGDTVIKSGAVLQVNREEALSANSNLVLDGGLLALGFFSYLIPGGVNDAGITVTESVDIFTRALGEGAGEVRFTGAGGFRAVGGDRTVNLGGAGAQVVWGEGHFVGDGSKLILDSDNTSKITFANAIDFGSVSRTIEITSNSTAEISGVLSGSGGLTKTGAGYLFLSGLNTYTGATRVEGGQLRLSEIGNAGGPSILGNTSNAASNLVLAGGQLNYVGSANSSTDRLFTIAGASGIVANNGTGTVHFTNTGAIAYDFAGAVEFELRGTNNGANRFDSLIANNGAYATSLRKGGAGNADSGGYWIIGNETNSYTGSTFINSGVLEVTKLSNGGQNSSIGASSNAAANLKFFRGGIKYTGDGDSTDRLFSISGYGSTYSPSRIDSSGSGALKFTNTGAIGQTTSAGGATGAIGAGGHLALGGTNTDDNTLAAAIGGNSATASRLTKDGAGKWILTGNSTYVGITEVLGGTLGVTSLKNGGITVTMNTTNGSTAASVTSTAGLSVGQSIEGPGIAAGTTITAINGTNITLSQAATATYTSGANRNKIVGEAGSIGISTNVAANLVINGGTLQYLGAGDSTDRRFTVGIHGATLDASGSGALTFSNVNAVTYATTNEARTLALTGTNTGNNTLAAAIGNAGTGSTSVLKNGSGKWVLSGNNSYTGGTQVDAGTLLVNHNAALGTGSATVNGSGVLDVAAGYTIANAVTVNSGGTLRLNGAVSSPVTFNGGTLTGSGPLNQELTVGSAVGQVNVLSPGNSAGSQNFGASQTWADGGIYIWEINDTDLGAGLGWDTINITGALAITATELNPFVIDIVSLTLSNEAGLVADFDPASNYSWTILTASEGITGFDVDAFSLNTGGFANGLAGGSFVLSQQGNSLVLGYNAVPEPGTSLLLTGAGCFLLFLRRRRVA